MSATTTNYGFTKPDGSDTIKASRAMYNAALDAIDSMMANNEIVAVTPNFSSLPTTFYDSRITADHKLVVDGEALLSNPSAQTGQWTINTAAGSYTISGSISGTTNVTMSMHIPSSTVTATT